MIMNSDAYPMRKLLTASLIPLSIGCMTLPAAAGMTREEVQHKCWQAGRDHGGPQSERDNITAQCFEQEGPAYSYDAMVYRESAKAAGNLDRSIKEGMTKNIRDCTGGTLHIGDDKT
jgi:hypothetical protein